MEISQVSSTSSDTLVEEPTTPGINDRSQAGRILVIHDDHYDSVGSGSEWTTRRPPEEAEWAFNWMNDCIRMDDESFTNGQLRQNSRNHTSLQKLATLSKQDLPNLRKILAYPGGVQIPLFKSETGDEYQLNSHGCDSLRHVNCPSSRRDIDVWENERVCQLLSLIPVSSGSLAAAIPNLVVHIGHLEVRTLARIPEHINSLEDEEDDPVTELTDYNVMIDPESDGMPVWLFVDQTTLIARASPEAVAGGPVPTLPIFRGLLMDEGNGYYDCAQVLPSIHCLGALQEQANAFDEACELVLKTRSIRHPALRNLESDKLGELISTKMESC